MRKIIKITLVLALLILPIDTLAADFKDMPKNWSTQALEKAVENGLLKGSQGKIMPDENLTRAEMATIVNRSFDAYKKASLSKFKDVQVNHWYYDEMAKAIKMKTFEGSGNMLYPNDKITREEAFVVIARALKVKPIIGEPKGFVDINQVSNWAKGHVYAMIKSGYVNGTDKKINPKGYITRAEFAKLMNNIIKEYIIHPGEYTSVAKGNVMVKSKDVILKDLLVQGDIIIGQRIDRRDITLENLKVEGRIIARSKGEDSIKDTQEKPNVDIPVAAKPTVNGEISTVFNHAYQENYNKDSLEKIEKEAKNAYVLLDADDSKAVKLIPKLKENNNIVSAYISVGTGETWRDDFNDLKPFLVVKNWDEWSGEYFVNDVNTGVLTVMKKRLDRLAKLGFQWVEFDNMDWAFDNQMRKEYGFKVTTEEAISYYQELAKYANSIGLKVMAKNTTIGADLFEGVTYESYSNNLNWWPEKQLKDFLAQGKLGLIVHYKENNPSAAYQKYQDIYGKDLLFIAESTANKGYVNFARKKN